MVTGLNLNKRLSVLLYFIKQVGILITKMINGHYSNLQTFQPGIKQNVIKLQNPAWEHQMARHKHINPGRNLIGVQQRQETQRQKETILRNKRDKSWFEVQDKQKTPKFPPPDSRLHVEFTVLTEYFSLQHAVSNKDVLIK